MYELHAPFQVLRKWRPNPQLDTRQRHDNTPVREHIDVSFLDHGLEDTRECGERYLLQKATTSLVITGFNSEHWTAILLTDCYFHTTNEYNTDTLGYYNTDSEEDGSNQEAQNDGDVPEDFDTEQDMWDPFTIGSTPMEKSENHATEYFLLSAACRMRQVQEESALLVGFLVEKINLYVSKSLSLAL